MTPPRPEPSSSRMVASYLTDVEKLLEAQCWDAALCEAYDLPRIAAALTDPTLQSSAPQQKTWCEQWIRPVEDDHDGSAVTCAPRRAGSSSPTRRTMTRKRARARRSAPPWSRRRAAGTRAAPVTTPWYRRTWPGSRFCADLQSTFALARRPACAA
jgi:hypothetical protein